MGLGSLVKFNPVVQGVGTTVGVAKGIAGALSPGGASGNENYLSNEQQKQNNYSAKIQERSREAAQEYRSNLAATQARQGQLAEESGRRDLATNMAGVRTASNRRGLLYSGIRQGAEAEAGQSYASNLGAQKQRIKDSTEATADAMESKAIGAGVANQQMMQAQADANYQSALNQRMAKNQMINSLLGTAGSAAGMFAGKV